MSEDMAELILDTTERKVSLGDEDICSWRKDIDRAENKPVLMIDINHTYIENRYIDELTKEDAVILTKALTMLIEDIEEHGL